MISYSYEWHIKVGMCLLINGREICYEKKDNYGDGVGNFEYCTYCMWWE